MSLIENIKNGKLIRGGILFVLAISPLPFGSVYIGVFSSIEIIIMALFMLWLIRVWLNGSNATTRVSEDTGLVEEGEARVPIRESRRQRHFSSTQDLDDSSDGSLNVQGSVPDSKHENQRQQREEDQDYRQIEFDSNEHLRRHGRRHKSRSVMNPLLVILGLIIVLVAFQMTPLPPILLKVLSPMTYQMYYSDMPDAKSIREVEGLSKAIIANPQKNLEEEQASRGMKKSVSDSLKSELGLGQGQPEEPWKSLSFNHQSTKLVFYKIVAITLHGITDFNMQIPANAMMFFFLLGLTARIMAGRLGGEEAGRTKRRGGETEKRGRKAGKLGGWEAGRQRKRRRRQQ